MRDTPLHCAIVSTHSEAVCMLIENGATIDDRAIVCAVRSKSDVICKILADHHASIIDFYKTMYTYGTCDVFKFMAAYIYKMPLKTMLLAILQACNHHVLEALIHKRYKPHCIYQSDSNIDLISLLLDEGITVDHLPTRDRIILRRRLRGEICYGVYIDYSVQPLDEDEVSPRDIEPEEDDYDYMSLYNPGDRSITYSTDYSWWL